MPLKAKPLRLDPRRGVGDEPREWLQAVLLGKAEGDLQATMKSLFAVAEAYPTLQANQNFLELQAQLEGTENRISVARRNFNESIKGFNSTLRVFPNNIFAGWYGFAAKGYFEAAAGAENAPKVEF